MTSLLWGDLDGFYEQCFVYMGLMLWHQEHWKLASVRWWGLSPDLLGREYYSCFFFFSFKMQYENPNRAKTVFNCITTSTWKCKLFDVTHVHKRLLRVAKLTTALQADHCNCTK